MIYIVLALSFFCVGFFGFGGPEAVLCLVEDVVVKENAWLTTEQFADLLIVSRAVPGECAVNAATLSGYAATMSTYGTSAALGASLAAMIGLALPAFVWSELIYRLRIPKAYKEGVDYGLLLLRRAIPGFIGAVVISLCTPEITGTPETPWHYGISLFLIVATFIGNLIFKINPLLLLLLSAIAGIALL